MLSFYLLVVAVFAIPLSLLIGLPYDLAQVLVYASLTWVFATSQGVYRTGSWAAAVLALGYALRGFLPLDSWGRIPLLAHIPDPFLLLGMLGLLYLVIRLPYRSAITWPGWLLIALTWLSTIALYMGIFQVSGHWPLNSFIFALLFRV